MLPLAQIRRYLTVGWRHRWPALLIAWVVCLAGWAGVYAIRDSYQSSARIYADADAILGQTLRGLAVDGATASQVETLQRTLLSRPNLERIYSRTDLSMRGSSVAEREEIITGLTRSIRLVPQARNLFLIEYRDHDPQIARAVVQATLDLFVERAASNDREQMQNARGFVNQQIANYEVQLREAERRRAEFRARYLDLLPSDALGGLSRFEAARTRLSVLRGELADAQGRRGMLRAQLAEIPATIQVTTVEGGDGRAAGLQQRLADLRTRYTEQHPEVREARAALARAGGGGGSVVRASRPNPAREPVELRVLEAEAAVASLERQVRDAGEEFERLEALARGAPQLQAEFTNLDRDYSVLRKSYEELLARREALQIAGAARTGADQIRLEVVEPPTVPTVPTSPNRPLLASGVLLAGLGVGVLYAFVRSLMDRSFYNVNELRELGVPVLGAISGPQFRLGVGALVLFVGALSLLFAGYSAVLLGGPELVAAVPRLLSRMLA
ncbi:hypothetical protein J8J14_10140 [Roseomonas sp. SSH11]|uniref:Tyrosine-protein kinase G-rich domain-containing protein n=2 Tax=Pararoseomonas baculiformis TaxID=2820812 RepID=A0ABS4ADP9_9PROT|nr:hypothetical protein [Pararoseomonas baculiformis]